MNCKNCGQHFEGKFCHNCGQSATVDRINLKYILNEIPTSFSQIDRGFFYTFTQLFVRPGYTIREFIDGKRRNHFKPLSYLLLAISIYLLLSYFLDTNTILEDVISGFKEGAAHELEKGGDGATEIQNKEVKFFDLVIKNQTLAMVFFLPFYSISSFLAFYKAKFNYYEHFILNAYVMAQQIMIFAILSPISLISKDAYATIAVLSVIFYNIWVFFQFFYDRKFISRVVSIASIYILNVVLFIITMLLSALLTVLWVIFS